MPDAFSPSLRIQLMQTGGDPDTWGVIANTQFLKFEDAITGDNGYAGGTGGISLTGQASPLALTVNNGTADQASQLLYPFVGTLTADFTVLLPGVPKIGWVVNATTGGHNVILKVGAGTTLTVPPGGNWTFFYCDGANVTAPTISFGSGVGPITVNGNATINGDANVSGTLSANTASVSGTLSANTASVSGTLSANTASVSGTVTANSVNASAGGTLGGVQINTNSITGTGTLSMPTISASGTATIGQCNATSGTIGGVVLASSGITASNLQINTAASIGGVQISTNSITGTGTLSMPTISASGTATIGLVNASLATIGAVAFSGSGNLTAGGTITAAAYVTSSDRRVKDDIRDIRPDEAIRWVQNGRPRRYTMKGKPSAGFIAQEDIETGRGEAIAQFADDAPIFADSDGYAPQGHRLVRDYNQDNAYLTAALKVALDRIEKLEARITDLEDNAD